MKRSQTNPAVSMVAVALLGACAVDPDPIDPVEPVKATVSGVVEIDNAIQNATVYIDLDDNNAPDSWEPQTTTDATGHYTLSWHNLGPLYAHTIGAVVAPTSTRVGVTGDRAALGFALHMRAPLGGDTTGAYVGSAVISPLTTLVVSEMAYDSTLTQAAAQAKVAGALSASQLPFSKQPLDVMSDYASDWNAGTRTSADSVQLRYVAATVAALVTGAVAKGNSVQSHVDCNDPMFFDPAIVAMDKQLTGIANGISRFSQLTSSQRTDVVQNPGNYHDYFMNTQSLADSIEDALIEAASEILAELFDTIKDKFMEALEQVEVELAADLLQELIEAII